MQVKTMARINFVLLLGLVLVCLPYLVKGQRKKNKGRGRGNNNRELPAVTLPPVTGPKNKVMSCDARNSCSSGRAKDFYESNCFCDDLCAIYGDCCDDFIGTAADIPVKITKKMVTCTRNTEINQSVEIYMVDKCPKEFDDSFIKMNCETEASLAMDQFLNLPVSGTVSKLLYKNYFCAVCAGETPEEISFWHVKVGCGAMPEGVNKTDGVAVIETTLQGSTTTTCGLEYFHPEIEARKCKSNIDRCLQNWNGAKKVVKKCKREPASYVYAGLEVFKNKFCAQCFDVNDTYLTCVDNRTPRPGDNSGIILTPPFSVLLDINTGSGAIQEIGVGDVEEKVETVVEVRQCPQDHIYDPFVQTCRRLRCPPGMEFQGGICVPLDGYVTPPLLPVDPDLQPVIPAEDKVTDEDMPDEVTVPEEVPVIDAEATTDLHKKIEDILADHEEMHYVTPEPEPSPDTDNWNEDGLRPEYYDLNCPMIALNQSEYFILANHSAYVSTINRAIPQEEYIISGDHILVCTPEQWDRNYTMETNVTTKVIMFKFDRYQGLVSFVGLLISLMALLIHFVVYMMLPPLRNTPGKCIISLVVALWVAQALFLAGNHLLHLPLACLIISAVMHYAFLAAFFWMNVMAIDICRTFNSHNMGSPSHGSGRCRFACYSLYAWIVPALIVGTGLALDLWEIEQFEPYRPHYADGLCWITRRMALLYLFALPLAAILFINIILYLITVCQICRISRGIKVAGANNNKERNRLWLYVKLSFIMGLTWVFGYLAALTDLWYMWYVFIAFNTLQGAFICFAFVCTRKVLKLLKESGRVHRSSDGRYHGNSSTSTTTLRSGYTRQTYLYDGEAKVISQETSI